jgi:ERCC4-type nuclease
MTIIIDSREAKIIQELQIRLGDTYDDMVKVEMLAIGDIMIGDMVIERKTLEDLASSIVDGRYKEQSVRLDECKQENNYKIYYFIEGDLMRYSGRSISREAIISCMYSLTHEKDFNVIQTRSVSDTVSFILQFNKKHNTTHKSVKLNTYSKPKSGNITQENISNHMLSQIPHVSQVTCELLMERFKHINHFIMELNSCETLLEDFVYTKDSKPKKLNKRVIENINYYLRSPIV